ncbi:MAG: PEP-CTERM sorting domain-containing protein [Planctomycetes bacterium]|nr:PEP-CTERM sorting domain-containing protein [Planctomycetota bacterium]
MIAVMVLAVVAGVESAAWADPVNGIYDSELSSQILEGRWSESFVRGGHGALGNTVHAASWDGAALATQWELGDATSGPAISAVPVLLQDNRDGNGDGSVIWYTVYSGGKLTLGSGNWTGAGDGDYTVTLTSYAHTTQYTYAGGGVLQTISTVAQMAGTFDGYPNYAVSFVIAHALPAGEGDTLPADYPSWVPDDVDGGHWGVCQEITMQIVPEPATLGLLAVGLAGLVARRRK